jgi:acyl-CoA synthetase (AMP-forming)/AMP-acid ligase II
MEVRVDSDRRVTHTIPPCTSTEHPSLRPLSRWTGLLRVGLARHPDAIAVDSAHRRLSWGELEDESARLAAGYVSLGLEPGDRVASLMPNRVALVVHYLACIKAGLVATPLNYRYTAREIDHALSVSTAAVLVAHAAGAAQGAAALHAHDDTAVRWTHPFDDLLTAEPLSRGTEFDAHRAAAIFFTSGSTGPAKGVTHTRESLRWMFASAVAAFELTADDVFLPASSMSHIGAILWPCRRCRWAAGSSWPGPRTPTRSCRCCAATSRPAWR